MLRRVAFTLTLLLVGASCGDGPDPQHGIDETRSVDVGSDTRRYRLVVPDTAQDPMPLVIVFHGLAGDPEQVRELSGFVEVASSEGFAVAFPQGAGLVSAWRTDAARAAPDVAFARAVVEDVAGAIDLDRERVYAAGMSNGGGMAGRLACEASDVFAAVGVVAAAHGTGVCDPQRPVPVIGFHGDADRIVPIEGIPSFVQDPRTWIASRADENGCGEEPSRAAVADDVESLVWGGCDADVVFYRIAGGAHGWPGSARAAELFDSTSSIDASRLMWEFFAARPMP